MKNLDITIKNDDGADIGVQIRDVLNSEDYYKYMILTPKVSKELNPDEITTKIYEAQQASGYHLILAMVINPPNLTEAKLRKMDYNLVNKLVNLIGLKVFPSQEDIEKGETDFLGREKPQEDSAAEAVKES